MTHYISAYVSPYDSRWDKASWIQKVDSADQTDYTIGTFDGDADGAYPAANQPRFIIDIAHGLSKMLGKQINQMKNFIVDSIRVDLLNSDDADDNDESLALMGTFRSYGPTNHRIDALRLLRTLERNQEADQLDADSLILTDGPKRYKGLRLGWNADDQVRFQTQHPFTTAAGIGSEWDIKDVFQTYDIMMSSQQGYENQLWSTRTGVPQSLGFTVAVNNNTNTSSTGQEYHAHGLNLDVLCGLVECTLEGSSTTSDDDVYLKITLGIKGWSDF